MLKIMEKADVGFNKWVLSYLDDSMNNILDIGCGGGKTILHIAKKCKSSRIYGIDYSTEAVNVANKLNRNHVLSGQVKIQQGNVLCLPFEDNVFDGIAAIRTHYFWDDLEAAMKEIFRIMNANGQLFILAEDYKVTYHMEHYNSTQSLKELLENIGFTKVNIHKNAQSFCVVAVK